MTDTTDVLETYEFYVQISEEDVRDGDATPWERVVAALAAEVRALRDERDKLQVRLNFRIDEQSMVEAELRKRMGWCNDLRKERDQLREKLAALDTYFKRPGR